MIVHMPKEFGVPLMLNTWIAVPIYWAATLNQFKEEIVFAAPAFKLRDSLTFL